MEGRGSKKGIPDDVYLAQQIDAMDWSFVDAFFSEDFLNAMASVEAEETTAVEVNTQADRPGDAAKVEPANLAGNNKKRKRNNSGGKGIRFKSYKPEKYPNKEEAHYAAGKTSNRQKKYKYLNGEDVNGTVKKNGRFHYVLTQNHKILQVKTAMDLRRCGLRYSDGTEIGKVPVHIDFDNAIYYVVGKNNEKIEVNTAQTWKNGKFIWLNSEELEAEVDTVKTRTTVTAEVSAHVKTPTVQQKQYKYLDGTEVVNKPVHRIGQLCFVYGEKDEKIWVKTDEALRKCSLRYLNDVKVAKGECIKREGATYFVINARGEKLFIKIPVVLQHSSDLRNMSVNENLTMTKTISTSSFAFFPSQIAPAPAQRVDQAVINRLGYGSGE